MKERLVVWVYYGDHHYLLLFQRGGFKKHGKQTSDWDEAATMRHALPQSGFYELEKHVGFIYSLFWSYTEAIWYPHLSFLKSQKSSEKKSNPPPISKAKVTHAWHDPDIWLRRADVVAPLSMTSSGTKSWLSTSAKGWPGRRSGLRAPMSSGTSSSLTPSTTKSLPGRRSGSRATKSFRTTWAIGKTSLEKCDVWPMLSFFDVFLNSL